MTLGTRSDPESSALLRQATALKDAGDILAAVACLRAAYEEIAHDGVDYGTKTFLRLPLYLQAAGHNDEAWREFNNLLTMGYPNQSKQDIFWETHLGEVYDKMRLFLQREGRYTLAINYGALSYIARLKGCLEAGTTMPLQLGYFKQSSTDDSIERVMVPLLRKAKVLHLTSAAVALVREWVDALPGASDLKFEERLTSLLNTKAAQSRLP